MAVDWDRGVGIVGHSMGGQATVRSASEVHTVRPMRGASRRCFVPCFCTRVHPCVAMLYTVRPLRGRAVHSATPAWPCCTQCNPCVAVLYTVRPSRRVATYGSVNRVNFGLPPYFRYAWQRYYRCMCVHAWQGKYNIKAAVLHHPFWDGGPGPSLINVPIAAFTGVADNICSVLANTPALFADAARCTTSLCARTWHVFRRLAFPLCPHALPCLGSLSLAFYHVVVRATMAIAS